MQVNKFRKKIKKLISDTNIHIHIDNKRFSSLSSNELTSLYKEIKTIAKQQQKEMINRQNIFED